MRKTEPDALTQHTPDRHALLVRENEIAEEKKPADDAERGGEDMQPVDAGKRKGSPTTRPCANSEMSGTAKEQSAADKINITEATRTAIKAGPVPRYLIPQTISAEIHAHCRANSGITVRRTGSTSMQLP